MTVPKGTVIFVFLCFAHGNIRMGADVIQQGIEVFLSREAYNLFLILVVNDNQIGYCAVHFPFFIESFGHGQPFINTLNLADGNIAAAI